MKVRHRIIHSRHDSLDLTDEGGRVQIELSTFRHGIEVHIKLDGEDFYEDDITPRELAKALQHLIATRIRP